MGSVGMIFITFPLLARSMEELLADSDSDMEDDVKRHKGRATKKVQRQRNQAWLKEGESDEPLNFLDPNVSQRVLGKTQVEGGIQRHGDASLGFCPFSLGKVRDLLVAEEVPPSF